MTCRRRAKPSVSCMQSLASKRFQRQKPAGWRAVVYASGCPAPTTGFHAVSIRDTPFQSATRPVVRSAGAATEEAEMAGYRLPGRLPHACASRMRAIAHGGAHPAASAKQPPIQPGGDPDPKKGMASIGYLAVQAGRRPNRRYSAGTTNKFRTVEVTRPPRITTASGCSIS